MKKATKAKANRDFHEHVSNEELLRIRASEYLDMMDEKKSKGLEIVLSDEDVSSLKCDYASQMDLIGRIRCECDRIAQLLLEHGHDVDE